ncbi:hypothetical protein Fmac_001984 [Flemingia macrophylla]|uniref:Uncharacterized protein n=1 Tax=Flemingia macrophylla TaxID=520843 RepID=A0ABD1NIN0_9FABA
MCTRRQNLDNKFGGVAVDAYVASNVIFVGQVTVWDGASVWPGCVLRNDLNKIGVDSRSNVQERSVLHAAGLLPQIVDLNSFP